MKYPRLCCALVLLTGFAGVLHAQGTINYFPPPGMGWSPGGNLTLTNPAGATDNKTTLLTTNALGSGSFGICTESDAAAVGDCLGLNRSGNTLTGLTWTFSGSTGGPSSISYTPATDFVLASSNSPHYRINTLTSTATTGNAGYDIQYASTILETWLCFGTNYTGAGTLAGQPSGVPSCQLGALGGPGTGPVTLPLSLGTVRSEMIRLDGNAGTLLLKVPASGSSHVAGVTTFSSINTAGVIPTVVGDSTNASSTTNLVGGTPAGTMANGVPIQTGYSGTTASCGGGALLAGACTDCTATVTGAQNTMAVAAAPAADPGTSITWTGFVSAGNTATVRVCALIAATPVATTYNVRVLQ